MAHAPNRPIKTRGAARPLGGAIRLVETSPRPDKPTIFVFTALRGAALRRAAAAIVKSLDRDLYRINLSAVISKYIGETEKNLDRVFDRAQSDEAVLLFDEADALFGKRTEVKDSHDRYAKIELNYLLAKLEAFRGIAVLSRRRTSDSPQKSRRIRYLLVKWPP